MGIYDTTSVTLGSAVGMGGTFTVAYPVGKSRFDYLGGTKHQLLSTGQRTLNAQSGEFLLAFGASNITVTMATGLALAANTIVYLNLDRASVDQGERFDGPVHDRVTRREVFGISLGAPVAAAANGYFASQDLTSAGVASVNTTVAAAIAAASLAGKSDFARNVVAAWTGTAVLTVTGTDEYGAILKESSASGTSFTGKKAFKTITSISVSANVTALTVGTGVVIGLPIFLSSTATVLKEIMDNAAATAGTIVAGDLTTPSATTGDIRGTYNPNSAPNGSRLYELIVAHRNPCYIGGAQFAG